MVQGRLRKKQVQLKELRGMVTCVLCRDRLAELLSPDLGELADVLITQLHEKSVGDEEWGDEAGKVAARD